MSSNQELSRLSKQSVKRVTNWMRSVISLKFEHVVFLVYNLGTGMWYLWDVWGLASFLNGCQWRKGFSTHFITLTCVRKQLITMNWQAVHLSTMCLQLNINFGVCYMSTFELNKCCFQQSQNFVFMSILIYFHGMHKQ